LFQIGRVPKHGVIFEHQRGDRSFSVSKSYFLRSEPEVTTSLFRFRFHFFRIFICRSRPIYIVVWILELDLWWGEGEGAFDVKKIQKKLKKRLPRVVNHQIWIVPRSDGDCVCFLLIQYVFLPMLSCVFDV